MIKSLRLWKNKKAANPYEFSPKNTLRRIRSGKPHSKYIAQSLFNHLKTNWGESLMRARTEGNSVKEQEYADKLQNYNDVTFDHPDQLQTLFKDDEFWPLPFQRTPDPASKEHSFGIPRRDEDAIKGAPTGSPTEPYSMEEATATWDQIVDDAHNLEKQTMYSLLSKNIDNALKQNMISPNTSQPFSGHYEKELIDKDITPPDSYFVSDDDYQDFINQMVDFLMDSDMMLQGHTQVNDSSIDDAESIDQTFTDYISKITPTFWSSFVDNSIMRPQMEREYPTSLSEEVYDEFGRPETGLERLEDPSALPAVETGAGSMSPKLDILSGLSQLERISGQPIENYVTSNMFRVHSILQMLKPVWKRELQELSGTPGMEQQVQEYEEKLNAVGDLNTLSSPEALSRIIDDKDFDLLGINFDNIIPMIDNNKEQYLSEVLWNGILLPSGSPPVAKNQFLSEFQNVISEKEEGISFQEMLNNEQENYEGVMEPGKVQQSDINKDSLLFVDEAVDRIGRQYGPNARELVQLFLGALERPADSLEGDLIEHVTNLWNQRHPDKIISPARVDKFLENTIKDTLNEVKQDFTGVPYDIEESPEEISYIAQEENEENEENNDGLQSSGLSLRKRKVSLSLRRAPLVCLQM